MDKKIYFLILKWIITSTAARPASPSPPPGTPPPELNPEPLGGAPSVPPAGRIFAIVNTIFRLIFASKGILNQIFVGNTIFQLILAPNWIYTWLLYQILVVNIIFQFILAPNWIKHILSYFMSYCFQCVETIFFHAFCHFSCVHSCPIKSMQGIL